MKKLLTLIPFCLFAICLIAYSIIGSRVLADGTLDEPFFLIPIAWLFFLIGILMVVVQLILCLKNKFSPKTF
ncbi:DUF3955 domain-containing protein [Intestinibacter sp.]|uniref:DUF3955 domain-containing protein n=1 Tax=Intestinibacter sp. TaxID=1965304 RepID=UPI003F1595C9